jgi:hypothetical protein
MVAVGEGLRAWCGAGEATRARNPLALGCQSLCVEEQLVHFLRVGVHVRNFDDHRQPEDSLQNRLQTSLWDRRQTVSEIVSGTVSATVSAGGRVVVFGGGSEWDSYNTTANCSTRRRWPLRPGRPCS